MLEREGGYGCYLVGGGGHGGDGGTPAGMERKIVFLRKRRRRRGGKWSEWEDIGFEKREVEVCVGWEEITETKRSNCHCR